MSTVKTAVSIDKGLFEKAEALAQERGIPRSQVFAQALEEYLERLENQRLFDQINAAYEAQPDDEEIAYRRQFRRRHRQIAEDDA